MRDADDDLELRHTLQHSRFQMTDDGLLTERKADTFTAGTRIKPSMPHRFGCGGERRGDRPFKSVCSKNDSASRFQWISCGPGAAAERTG